MHLIAIYSNSIFSYLFELFDDAFYENLSILAICHMWPSPYLTLLLHYLIALLFVNIYLLALNFLNMHLVFIILDVCYFVHIRTILFGTMLEFLLNYFQLRNF